MVTMTMLPFFLGTFFTIDVYFFFCIDSGFHHPLLKNVPGCLWKSGSEKRENNYFFKTQHKRRQCFWHRYIYNNNKSIYIQVIKKSLKKGLRPFNEEKF